MKSYTEASYGEHIAPIYDELYSTFDEAAITTLAELAHGGRALELGIGTGRIALPLRARGIEVHGVDASPAMVEKLRAKPGGASIPVVMGDFADVPVEGQFSLIFVVFNTFFSLLTQERQVQCFANVARHLTPDGVFVLEVFVPDVTRFHGRQSVRVVDLTENTVRLDATLWDPVNQIVSSQHIHLGQDGVHLYPVKLRYAWPTELDLMARLAGLRLRDRWSNWQKAPFTAEASKHISVYGRALTP